MRGWRSVWVAAAVCVLAAGCTGSDLSIPKDEQAARVVRPIAVSAPDVQGPGTKLGDGFAVPDHAVLLGHPIPQSDGTRIVSTTSYLAVAGDLRAQFLQLVTGAEEAGWRFQANGDPARGFRSCSRQGRAATCVVSGSWQRGREVRRSQVVAWRAASPHPSSFALVIVHAPQRYATVSAARAARAALAPPGAGPSQPGASTPPVPTGWEPVPIAGQAFGVGFDEELQPPLTVPTGSRPIAAAIPITDGAPDGAQTWWHGLVAITGRPPIVFDRWVRAAVAALRPQQEPQVRRSVVRGADSALVRNAVIDIAGGPSYALTMVVPRTGRPTLLIETAPGD